jgi:hypothetical protein
MLFRKRYLSYVFRIVCSALIATFLWGQFLIPVQAAPLAAKTPSEGQLKYASAEEQPVSLKAGMNSPASPLPLDPSLTWSTFLGSSTSFNTPAGITVDANGNIYVTGYSRETWGDPVLDYSGSLDVFVVKLDSHGSRLWNTFLGGASSSDSSYGIALDNSGKVDVVGVSNGTWGAPQLPYTGGQDAFVAQLDSSNGALKWNTFLGAAGKDFGTGIALDGSSNIYLSGYSDSTWGTPYSPHTSATTVYNTFVAKLDSSGGFQWNTFLGSGSTTVSNNSSGIVVDGSGNVNVTGYSGDTWGSPINGYNGGATDAYVAQLDSSDGALKWNTFLGLSGNYNDYGDGIVLDSSNQIEITGYSRDATSHLHAFASQLTDSGNLNWMVPLGSSVGDDTGQGIATDANGNVYVTGFSSATWGSSPLNPFSGGAKKDAFVAELDGGGVLQWNTFMGSSTADDLGFGISVDHSGRINMIGISGGSWGSPRDPFSSTNGLDAFLARLSTPILTAHGNGQTIPFGSPVPATTNGTDFGSAKLDGEGLTQTFTLVNAGNDDLTLSGSPLVEILGTDAADFILTKSPSSPIEPGSQSQLAIQFKPTAKGLRQATVSIANNSSQAPFPFAIQGTGTSTQLYFLPLINR